MKPDSLVKVEAWAEPTGSSVSVHIKLSIGAFNMTEGKLLSAQAVEYILDGPWTEDMILDVLKELAHRIKLRLRLVI